MNKRRLAMPSSECRCQQPSVGGREMEGERSEAMIPAAWPAEPKIAASAERFPFLLANS